MPTKRQGINVCGGTKAVLSPLTGRTNCILVKEERSDRISKRWHEELGISWQPPLGVKKIQYWRDLDTNLCFYSPKEVAGGADLYSQLQKFPWYYMEVKWEFDKALNLLKKSINQSSGCLLEIGVGRGSFLELAREAGFDVAGVELNPEAAAIAREKGFVIYEQDLVALKRDRALLFNVICSFQVLEHLSEPGKFLVQSLDLLKPGGMLILSVPNASVARQIDPERNDLLDQPPHHMSHWDETVFRSMEDLLPLKLKHVAFEPLAPYHVDWFMGTWSQRLRTEYGRFAGQLVFNRLSSPVLRTVLNLGARRMVRGHTLMVCFQKSELI